MGEIRDHELVRSSVLKHKSFLYVTEFFSGMSVMAVELGASRLLAPYFSSSQIVWTVIIGTIMVALALGALIGGRLADKYPDPNRLYRRILIAACWIAAIPFLGKYVIALISLGLASFVSSNFLVWASLVSCFAIFVFPLILLGTVTPSLIKLSVESLEHNGKTVGELSALNTIGSIIGTFLPTFVTIPTVGTAATFLIFAAILSIICLIYFLSVKRRWIRALVITIIILVLSFVPFNNSFAFWEPDLTYEGESIYNYLQVKENDRQVILSTNTLVGVQSIMMKEESLTGMYYDYALAAPFMAGLSEKGNEDRDILILGLGTGTYATQCQQYFDGVSVTGVEIDQKIVDLAYEYFELSDAVDVSVYDGRAYLQTGEGKDKLYDVIMVDAYQDITIPFQMSTTEFFSLVRDHLKEDGVMVVNMNMRSGKDGSINDYLCDTISTVFDSVCTVKVSGGTNMELFAANGKDLTGALASACGEITENRDLRNMMLDVASELTPVTGGDRILTDDKAPVELLGMKVIDELIEGELDDYRSILDSAGVSGIMDLLK
ncbi:MAG: spermidine synthase [Clostridiales bacterium]|nr:spermidine synthase [Clostridiales bacterium]